MSAPAPPLLGVRARRVPGRRGAACEFQLGPRPAGGGRREEPRGWLGEHRACNWAINQTGCGGVCAGVKTEREPGPGRPAPGQVRASRASHPDKPADTKINSGRPRGRGPAGAGGGRPLSASGWGFFRARGQIRRRGNGICPFAPLLSASHPGGQRTVRPGGFGECALPRPPLRGLGARAVGAQDRCRAPGGRRGGRRRGTTGRCAPSQTGRYLETNPRLPLHFRGSRGENAAAPEAQELNKPRRKRVIKNEFGALLGSETVKAPSRRWHRPRTDSQTKENNTSLVRSFFWTLFKV